MISKHDENEPYRHSNRMSIPNIMIFHFVVVVLVGIPPLILRNAAKLNVLGQIKIGFRSKYLDYVMENERNYILYINLNI